MASCVSITYVNGELVGDPLDIAMFESTGWILDETVAESSFDPDQVIIGYVYPPDCGQGAQQERVPFSSSGSSDMMEDGRSQA